MKKDNSRLIATGTVVICVITFLLAALNLYSTQQMNQAASAIYEHPYTVSNRSREMRSRLLDMKQFISIFLTDGFVSEEETFDLLQHRYDLQQESIDIITAQYLGPREDTQRLQETMNELIAVQQDAVYYVRHHSDAEIMAYIQTYVFPRYDAISDTLSGIITFADNKVHGLEQESRFTANVSMASTALLSVFIVILSVSTNRHLEKKRTREVAYREKLFDLLTQNVDEVYFIYNLQRHALEYASSNCQRIFGIPTDRFEDRQTLYPLLSEEDRGRMDAFFAGDQLRQPGELDFKMTGPDGEGTRWMTMKVYPIFEEGLVQYVVSITDQTERILIQRNLQDALVMAQNANRAKKDFLSRMSHEIRTPMNAIIGMTTIAAAHMEDRKRVEDCLSKIGFSSRHLLSIINDVLDMSKIEEGKLTISQEPFDFQQLISSVSAIVNAQAAARSQSFDVTLTGLMGEILVGDSMRLNQILLNLLSNAVKFTPPEGSVRLDIRQLSVKGGQTRLRFTVSDTGIGMSAEALEHLYTPFEQANSGIAQKYGGTGLGMSITHNLVNLLGGTIDVHSQPGQGTVFTVELPFGLGPEEPRRTETQNLEFLQVLVVDDDQDTCVHTAILLERLGIAAKWVLSGAEAVVQITEAHETGSDFDVCFIDWRMPEMDGIETTRRIRACVGPDTPIIIISAYDWGPIEAEARAAGANAFISKPMFSSTIYNTLLTVTSTTASVSTGGGPSRPKRDFTGRRILLAEDNELNMEIALELLDMVHVQVDCAVNGREAADKVLSAPPGYYDLVLMDVQMPVMNGYEATRAIRASRRPGMDSLPILAMTADAFTEDVSASLEAGMNGHIAKPIDVELLYETLDAIFSRDKTGLSAGG